MAAATSIVNSLFSTRDCYAQADLTIAAGFNQVKSPGAEPAAPAAINPRTDPAAGLPLAIALCLLVAIALCLSAGCLR